MAARRLVVVMLVLLAVSTLAAALLPQPENRETPPPRARPKPDSPPAKGTPQAEQDGLLLVARMRVGRRQPKTVRVQRGDQLRLAVTAPFGDDVEIPRLGLTLTVTQFAPASFDLLANRLGTFPVRTVDSGLVAGRLLVGRPGSGRCGASRPEARQGRGSIPSCAPRDRQRSRGRDRSARRP